MCTGSRGSSKLPRNGCSAVVGANGQLLGAVFAPKQRASTVRSVNGAFGAGPFAGSPDPEPVVAGGGDVVVVGSVVVGAGDGEAAGAQAAALLCAGWPAGAAAGLTFAGGVVVDGPSTE